MLRSKRGWRTHSCETPASPRCPSSPSGHGGSELTTAAGQKARESSEGLIHGQSAAVFQLLLLAGKLSKQFLQILAAVTFVFLRAYSNWSLHACFFPFETSITFFFPCIFLFPLNISAQRWLWILMSRICSNVRFRCFYVSETEGK